MKDRKDEINDPAVHLYWNGVAWRLSNEILFHLRGRYTLRPSVHSDAAFLILRRCPLIYTTGGMSFDFKGIASNRIVFSYIRPSSLVKRQHVKFKGSSGTDVQLKHVVIY
jgi:hypothetical protein